MEVIGIKNCNYKFRDGESVQGLKLFLTDQDVKVDDGIACDALFISDATLRKIDLRPADIQVGDHLNISYNKYGKIQSIAVQ